MKTPPETPTLSILLPTYCQAGYLAATIESVLNQQFEDFEIVIADDASPDHTAEVVREFQDHRIRYCPASANLGRVANYRRALYELARGRYATNLDGDDLLGDPEFLATAVNLMEQNPRLSLVYGTVIRFVGNPPPLTDFATPGSVRFRDGSEHFLEYWKRDRTIHHLGTVYRVRQAREIDFYRREIISSDIESLLRLLPGYLIAEVDTIAGMWRGHQSNASVGISVAAAIDNIGLIDSVYDELYGQGILSHVELGRWRRRMLWARIYGSTTTHFFSKGRCKAGLSFLRRAFQFYPVAIPSVLCDVRLWLHLLMCAAKPKQENE